MIGRTNIQRLDLWLFPSSVVYGLSLILCVDEKIKIFRTFYRSLQKNKKKTRYAKISRLKRMKDVRILEGAKLKTYIWKKGEKKGQGTKKELYTGCWPCYFEWAQEPMSTHRLGELWYGNLTPCQVLNGIVPVAKSALWAAYAYIAHASSTTPPPPPGGGGVHRPSIYFVFSSSRSQLSCVWKKILVGKRTRLLTDYAPPFWIS